MWLVAKVLWPLCGVYSHPPVCSCIQKRPPQLRLRRRNPHTRPTPKTLGRGSQQRSQHTPRQDRTALHSLSDKNCECETRLSELWSWIARLCTNPTGSVAAPGLSNSTSQKVRRSNCLGHHAGRTACPGAKQAGTNGSRSWSDHGQATCQCPPGEPQVRDWSARKAPNGHACRRISKPSRTSRAQPDRCQEGTASPQTGRGDPGSGHSSPAAGPESQSLGGEPPRRDCRGPGTCPVGSTASNRGRNPGQSGGSACAGTHLGERNHPRDQDSVSGCCNAADASGPLQLPPVHGTHLRPGCTSGHHTWSLCTTGTSSALSSAGPGSAQHGPATAATSGGTASKHGIPAPQCLGPCDDRSEASRAGQTGPLTEPQTQASAAGRRSRLCVNFSGSERRLQSCHQQGCVTLPGPRSGAQTRQPPGQSQEGLQSPLCNTAGWGLAASGHQPGRCSPAALASWLGTFCCRWVRLWVLGVCVVKKEKDRFFLPFEAFSPSPFLRPQPFLGIGFSHYICSDICQDTWCWKSCSYCSYHKCWHTHSGRSARDVHGSSHGHDEPIHGTMPNCACDPCFSLLLATEGTSILSTSWPDPCSVDLGTHECNQHFLPDRSWLHEDKTQQQVQFAPIASTPILQQFWFLILLSGVLGDVQGWSIFGVFLVRMPSQITTSGLTRSLARLLIFSSSSYSIASSHFSFVLRERTAERCAFVSVPCLLSWHLAQPARCLSGLLVRLPRLPEGSWPARVAQRWSPARRHGVSCSLHPARGRRIGEASHPGPGNTSSSPRGPELTDRTVSTIPTTGNSTTAPQGGDGMEIQHVQLKLKAISGRLITLQCRWLKRDAAWKWFAETQGTRLHHQGKSTPATVLHEWLERFDQHLSAEGVREIESALAIHPDPPHGPPDSLNRTPAGSDQMAGTPAAPSTPAFTRLPGTPLGPRVPATPISVPPPGPAPSPCEARPPSDLVRRRLGCAFWLGRPVPTQRQLPKTSRYLVDAACHRLLLLLGDPAITAEQRRLLVALALTMPRWLWPEPAKAPGSQLHPHARPRLLQERAQLLLQNDWDSLLLFLEPEEGPPDNPADTPPRTPGLLTDADCHRLMRAGRQGRVATAWRQLFSFGLALSNDRTQKLIADKWIPSPLFPDQLRGTFLSPSDAKDLVTDDRLMQASRTLASGCCTDALGWTHEAWRAVLQLPHGKRLIRELLTLYACGEIGHEGEDLINSSLLIPLYKNSQGDTIRPIAVPTVFRKTYARATLAQHRPALCEACGPHQYAAMTKDGARLIATHLRCHQQRTSQPTVYIRTDIRNAFNEMDRQQVLRSLEGAHPLLAASQFPWLHRPSQAVMHASSGPRRILSTHKGIPQGDPLSSLTFQA